MDVKSIKLTKKIMVGDEETGVLDMRPPIISDIKKIGFPYLIKDGGMQILPDITAKYISALAAIPPSSVEMLSINDFNTLQTEILSFLGDGVEQ